jgi:hypothetical protein
MSVGGSVAFDQQFVRLELLMWKEMRKGFNIVATSSTDRRDGRGGVSSGGELD